MMYKDYAKGYQRPVACPPSAPTCADCQPAKHPYPQNIIFNCCTGAGVNAGVIALPNISPPQPAPLVCTALDTTCLCRPIVNVEFDCNIGIVFIEAFDAQVSLTFELKKSCDNGQEVVCGTWVFTKNNLFISSIDSFAFRFCDSNPCPSCCTYTVEVSFEVTDLDALTISVNAPTLKATAAEFCGVSTNTFTRRELKYPSAAPVCADCEPQHPCPQSAIFHCCTGTGISNTGICPPTPLSLVSVTVDTTCLCSPLVVLDFSTVINSVKVDGNITKLIFQVKKSCDNRQEVECGSWTFEKFIGQSSITTSDTFRFTFCDCNPCRGCCTYSVELASCNASTIDDAPFEGSFSIETPAAAVLAVDTCPQ